MEEGKLSLFLGLLQASNWSRPQLDQVPFAGVSTPLAAVEAVTWGWGVTQQASVWAVVEHSLWSQTAWGQGPALPLTSRVTLGKSLYSPGFNMRIKIVTGSLYCMLTMGQMLLEALPLHSFIISTILR